MVMVFSPEVKRDMEKFALKVPMFSEPSNSSTVIKYFSDKEAEFLFLKRGKGAWIKVVDQTQDTGWISSYFLRFKPGQ